METTLTTIEVNPNEYGIQQKQVNELLGNLPQIKAEREVLSQLYDEVVLLDIEDSETSKRARELRLNIRDNRTKGIDVWHKTTKEFFLKGGQFVDAIKRKEIAENIRMEENLESIEKHAENKEKERKAQLNAARVSELEPFNAFVPIGLNFGEISEEEFQKVLNGAKLQHEAQVKAEKEAEVVRQRIAEIQKLHSERKESLLPLWQFIDNKEVNFGELSEKEFAQIHSESVAKEAEYLLEQEKIRKENERLAKEKAEAEAKAKKISDRHDKLRPYITYIRDYDNVLNLADDAFEIELYNLNKEAMAQMRYEAEENAKKEAELENERKAKAKIEAELQARKDAEAKAEKERIEAENKAKKEAEKLAKAPVKKQLSTWVNSFEIPHTEIQNDKAELIKSKFEAFKKWALSEVESI